jgi:DNA-binding HxlR family transcriptional regulator
MANAIDIAEPSVAAGSSILRLLAADPSAAIVAVLADGPLRSGRLREALPSHSARTVYRRLEELERLGVIERLRLNVNPPAIAYELTAPAGRDLLDVVEGPVEGWLRLQASSQLEERRSASLALLAETWETQIFHALGCEERSLTEIGEETELTHHQAGSRAKRLAAAGILDREAGKDRITRYLLSDVGRLGAAVIGAAARWEETHLTDSGNGRLDLDDCTSLLAGALALPRLRGYGGRVFGLTVEAEPNGSGEPRVASVWAEVGETGAVACGLGSGPRPDAWAHGAIPAWLAALVDGRRGALRVGGESALVDAHLTRLHAELRRLG